MADKKKVEFNVFGISQQLPMHPNDSNTKDVIMLESTVLFAKRGYQAVSIRDIANTIKMKPSSLYNHFPGKEALFDAVLDHAEDLYLLYFKYLDDSISKAQTFNDVMDRIIREPSKMSNEFTCYAFSLIQTEQFRDEHCSRIYNETFLDYSINFFKTWFDRCVEKGLAQPFDTKTAATIIINSSLICINLKVQEFMGHRPPINFIDHFMDIKNLIMRLAGFHDADSPFPALAKEAPAPPPAPDPGPLLDPGPFARNDPDEKDGGGPE
ncbi:MAG: TetR/AcrR family transcriptional regulator [Deltaproteobacteria bacterium]|jgi:AcrR family transcriptional regulator|nr:TetR/AcrR family transcriptional regulator [Deltaproteobacteria bacterium]